MELQNGIEKVLVYVKITTYKIYIILFFLNLFVRLNFKKIIL
jgi:hypothetical protein